VKGIDHYRQVRRTAIAILNYLRDHPKAKDTLEGIAKFWVGESEENVNEALALLIKEGALEKKGQVFQLAQSWGEIYNNELIEKILQRLN
jgi:hypothetical protein